MIASFSISEYKSDYIQFLNNGIIGQSRFSGYRYPFKFISKRSHVEMLFVTDSRLKRSGFELRIKIALNNGMLDYIIARSCIGGFYLASSYRYEYCVFGTNM